MKILTIHNLYKHAGGERAVFEKEAALLRERGHDVSVFVRDNAEIDDYSPAEKAGLFFRTSWSRRTFGALLLRLREDPPDIAHMHNTFPLISPSAYHACQASGVPVVQTLHNFRLLCPAATLFRNGAVCEECLGGSLAPAVKHRCYRNSRSQTLAVKRMLLKHRRMGSYSKAVDGYIALTAFHKHKFIEGGLPADRIFIKPNFVEPAVVASARGAEKSGKHVLYLGRLSAEKGVQTLLNAWKQLHDTPLFIAGDGPERDALEEHVRDLDLRGVRLLGHQPRAKCQELLAGAACLVVPSLWYEGMPMVVLEAFAMGVPVLASKIGGLQEIVKPGLNGELFSPGDSAGLAAAAKRILSEPAARERLAAGAKSSYDKHYTPARNYELLMQIYAQVKQRMVPSALRESREPKPADKD